MTRYKSYKFRIYPTQEQARQINLTIDCCRFVYNHMLERNMKIYKRRGEHLSVYDMNSLLPEMKTYLPWLTEADNRALKCACVNLDRAYQRFFKKIANYPKFKSKRRARQSYTTVERVHFKNQMLKVPKVGWLRTSERREIREHICEVAIIRDHDKYFASVQCKYESEVDTVSPVNCIGLDYKSDGLYVDSDGGCCDMPHYYKVSQEKIAKEHRKLSKKRGNRKGEIPSRNFYKQLNRLQKKTRHVANQRRDFLHKKSTEIANQYDLVAVESLSMEEIAGGMRLGKATKDNAYGAFLQMLEYKLEDRGKTLVKVDRFFPSSQLCSCCGMRNHSLRDLHIREWTCPNCGEHHDRDVNAAVNILNEGLRMMT